ncbi:MAG: hypothetical protein WCC21_07675 [Candidatus Acidiferrales bacterium]
MFEVPVCRMRMMRRRQMIVSLMVFGGFAMVSRRVRVMFRCLVMMLRCLFGHAPSQILNLGRGARRYRLSINGV